jgi:hypothetical protein
MLRKIWVLAVIGILSVASIHAQDEVQENSEVIEDDGAKDVHVAALAKTDGPCACIETEGNNGKKYCFRPACSEVPECEDTLKCRGTPMKKVEEMEQKRSLRQEKLAARRAMKTKNRIKNRRTKKPKRPSKNKIKRKNQKS